MKMYKNILTTLIRLFTLLALTACATPPVWKAEPNRAKIENASFIAELEPVCHYERVYTNIYGGFSGCNGFELSIKNKTSSNIELDWNKTLYVASGQTSGGFMFEGIIFAERNNPKLPDVIFAGGTLKKIIWPNNFVEYSGGQYGSGWYHRKLNTGEQGIFLTTIIDGKIVNEKITIKLIEAIE